MDISSSSGNFSGWQGRYMSRCFLAGWITHQSNEIEFNSTQCNWIQFISMKLNSTELSTNSMKKNYFCVSQPSRYIPSSWSIFDFYISQMTWLQRGRQWGGHPEPPCSRKDMLPQLLGTLQLSPLSAPSGTTTVAESISPKVAVLPVRKGCRCIKVWPSHPNSELCRKVLPAQSSQGAGQGYHWACISAWSLSTQSYFLPSSSSELIPRILLNKSPIQSNQSTSR